MKMQSAFFVGINLALLFTRLTPWQSKGFLSV
jgi:hypothetical protein